MKYLLDTNVLKEISRPQPHENVAAWLGTVDDSELAISVISVREIWKGVEKKRQADAAVAKILAVSADTIFASLPGAYFPWTKRLRGVGEKRSDNRKSTSMIPGWRPPPRSTSWSVVTRNVSDFEGRGVAVLDPFKKSPKAILPKS